MTKLVLTVSICVLLAATALAQAKKSAVGTWTLDLSKSQVESQFAPKSVTIIVLKDTPADISWRVRMVDEKGKTISYAWHGPADGSMHPVIQNGKSIGNQSAKKDEQGALLRHGEDPSDGSSFDARSTISDDGHTMTDEITDKTKEGKETKSKWVYHRVS